jgi:hypothetical protein
MTLITVAASGRNDQLANGKSKFFVNNALTGETIFLQPAADGLFADLGMATRYGHQKSDTDGASISSGSLTGYGAWQLGTRSTFVTLSPLDVAAIYAAVNTFGSDRRSGDAGRHRACRPSYDRAPG